MNPQSLCNHLAEYMRAEIASKHTAIKWIDAQEQALAANDIVAFEAAVAKVNELLSKGRAETSRRGALLAQLAAEWKVPVQTMTLGGVARRLGTGGAQLEALRHELRDVVAKLMKRNRRLAALIGMHRRITTDIMQLMLGCESAEQVDSGGALVNAQA